MAGYVICSVERSGSTLLSDLLEATGVAGCPMVEPFNMRVERAAFARYQFSDYGAYIEFARRRALGANGVFGINLMWRHLSRLDRRLQSLYPSDSGGSLRLLRRHMPDLTRFIFTQRRDTIAQAVSWAIAYQTDRWRSFDSDLGRVPSYDFELIDALHQSVLADTVAWETWFSLNAVQPHVVVYEDLVADTHGTLAKVLEFLEVSPVGQLDAAPRVKRQGEALNVRWSDRYREDAALAAARPLPEWCVYE